MRYHYTLIGLLWLFLLPNPASAQWVLVDSITAALEQQPAPPERMDLLLGLCRAQLFAAGAPTAKGITDEAMAYALEIGDSTAYGRALCYSAQANLNDIELGRTSSELALGIGLRHGDRDLEFMGRYHLIEYWLYDRNDFTTSRQLIGASLNNTAGASHKNLGNFYKVVAIYHQYEGRKDSAVHYHHLALEQFGAVGTDPLLAPGGERAGAERWDKGGLNAAQIQIYLSRFDKQAKRYATADSSLQLALAEVTSWRSDDMRGWVMEELGALRQEEGRTAEAIAAFEEALRIYQNAGNTKYLSLINREIGNLFLVVDEPVVAETYFERGYQSASSIGDSLEMSTHRMLGGRVALKRKDYPTARTHLDEALAIARLLKDTLSTGYILADLASLELANGRVDVATNTYLEAISIHRKYSSTNFLISGLSGLGGLYLESGQLDSARHYLAQADSLSSKHAGLALRTTTTGMMVRLAELEGDYPTAFRRQQAYQQLQDSLFSQRSQASLRSAQVRQNVADYQAETAAARRASELLTQRNRLYLILAITLLGLLFLGGFLLLKLRRARQNLALQNEELGALNATKDRFFGIIAHDLRNPVAALSTADRQIEHYLGQDRLNKVSEVAGQVGQTTRKLGRLLDNLLGWALSQQGMLPYRPEQLEPGELIEEALDLHQETASAKGIELNYELAPNTSLFADRNAMAAILRNLVSNAVKFTPRGGRVIVSGKSEKGRTYLKVTDDGVGVDQSRISRLFSPALKSEVGTAGERGNGLGLVLVRDLAHLNHGTVTVASTPGTGSTFTLNLPARSQV